MRHVRGSKISVLLIALALPILAAEPLAQRIGHTDPNLTTPYLQQFNFDVQQQVMQNLLVDVAYVGKLGRHLLIGLDSNPAIYEPGATLNNENARRIYQGYGQNNILSTIGNSAYNGLQIGVTKRCAHGFTLQGSYTFSRSLDDSSSYTETAAVPNVFDLHTQSALSDFSAKHIASASWIWDLPKIRMEACSAALNVLFLEDGNTQVASPTTPDCR